MTNSPASSPVNQLQPNLSASPRILNFNNSNSGGQQAYVLQDQQNNLNLMNNVNTNHTGFSNGINGSNMVLNSAGQATNAQGTVQNSNGQIFLNINNRIVPIQTLNVKQTSNSNPTGGSPGAVGNVIQQNSSQVQSTGQRVQIISKWNLTFFFDKSKFQFLIVDIIRLFNYSDSMFGDIQNVLTYPQISKISLWTWPKQK